MLKEILQIIISWPTATIAICVTLIILRKSINRLIERLIASKRGKAKLGPLEIDFQEPTDEAQKVLPSSEAGKVEALEAIEEEGPPEEEVEKSLRTALDLLLKEKNYREAQKVFYEEVKAQLTEDEKLLWEATVLRYSHALGDTDALHKLEEMEKQNPGVPEVIKELAHRYREMGEFEEAKKRFLLAKEQYDIEDEDQRYSIVDCYVQAGVCLASANKYDASIDMLKQILGKNEFKDQYAKILRAMAYIAKNKKSLEDFTFYAEASLSADPLNIELRFDVAYTYSNMGREKLSLLHYKKLADITPQAGTLNNLGICYDHLKLKAKAISSYLKSAEQKETLAMGNLAFAYLNAGFVNAAKEVIDQANKYYAEDIEVNPRVASALNKLEYLKKEEDQNETKFLKEAEQERKFRLKYSEAKLSEKTISKNNWQGPWDTPWGEAKIAPDEKSESFKINLHTKEEDKLASVLVPSFGFLQPTKIYKERYIVIDGRISGLTGRYTIQIDDTKQTTILASGKLYSATGYMIINESCFRIEIMEKTADDKTEFKEWKKVGGDESVKSEVKTSE